MPPSDSTLGALLRTAPEPRVVLGVDLLGTSEGGGSIARFLRERRGRALDLYLLFRAVAGPHGGAVALPAIVWARALGLDDLSSPEVTISRTWTWLEEAQLVRTQRAGRQRVVSLLSEDGSGEAFLNPRDRSDWFVIPFAYFLGNYHNRINVAGKCVLLAALANRGTFEFTSGPPASWYGFSRDSVKRGIRVLLTLGLLVGETQRVPDPLTAAGYRLERRYAVTVPLMQRTGAG